jgi:hypothetical protein
MKFVGFCLLASLLATAGCLDLRGMRSAQKEPKTAPAAVAAPSRPPVTEDQVTEGNASAAAQALTDELDRAAISNPTPAASPSAPARQH